jgi:hypothetical protein
MIPEQHVKPFFAAFRIFELTLINDKLSFAYFGAFVLTAFMTSTIFFVPVSRDSCL